MDELLSDLQIPMPAKSQQGEHSFSLSTLKWVLAPLTAMMLDDKVLPKYRYPSGGSAYAIQCYVVVHEAIGGLREGAIIIIQWIII